MTTATYGRRRRLTQAEENGIVEAVRQAVPYREIAQRYGVTRSTVARVVKRRGVQGHYERRVAPAVAAAIRAPSSGIRVLVAPTARPEASAAPRPIVAAAAPGPLSRSEEAELVEQAIAAGIGVRYERVGGASVHIAGVHDALAWCDRAGFRVEIRAKSGSRHLALYRVWRPGRRSRAWIGAPELTALVRALAAHDAFRAVPLRDCFQSHNSQGDNPQVNPPDNPFRINRISHLSVAV